MSRRRSKCCVPHCPNSFSKTPNKVFVNLNENVKRKWFKQINVEYNPQQRLYCCEDHLNLKEDLVNYYEWKFMKASPRLKSTVILKYSVENVFSHANIQTENKSGIDQIETRKNPASELEKLLLQPIDKVPSRPIKESHSTSTCVGPVKVDVATQCHIQMMDKSTIVNKHVHKTKPSITMDIDSTPTTVSASPSQYGSTLEADASESDLKENDKEISCLRMYIINLIYSKPKMYLGLPKQYLCLIKEIAMLMAAKELDILITLFKIKLNDSMTRVADQFVLSRPTVTKSFYNGIIVLANYFQNYVFMPTPAEIKQNLPLVFKIRYSRVQCILNAIEIKIEKPTDPQAQAQTRSQYKHCNTIKYLVGCTPNGFISYISKGYGGRISDKTLVEKSDLIEMLPTNAVVMADRGFKEIETLLMSKHIKLIRPPSVYSTNKPTQQKVLQTKVIASLRVHIERVIRRIRYFQLLKPHSVVSNKHVKYLDKILIITCGLINLQNEIIKH